VTFSAGGGIFMAAQSLNSMRVKNIPGRGSSRRRLDVGALFLSMALLLVVTVAGTFWIGELLLHNTIRVAEVHGVVDLLNDILFNYRDAESGQRGYLLTQDPAYLVPYTRAVGRIPDEAAQLDADVRAGLLPARDVAELHRLGDLKLAELRNTVALAKKPGGMNAALDMVRSDVGLRYMDDLHDLVYRMISQREGDLSSFQLAAEHMTESRSAAFAATAVINLLFLLWAFNRVQREIRARQAAADDLAREQRLTAVTLASIGDAVMVTDAAGRITFLNRVAETLTGWTAAEAIDQPCAKIFNIVNESTRQTTESPVEKVMRTGAVQGLANHTVLIRKDGSEIPIDDSGAPIRGDDAVVYGVVLVFRDFSDRKKYELELQQAKEEAETANIAKDNFLAALSHELRTPLTPVLVTLTSWEQGESLPPVLREDVQTLRRCVELEARLIDDLLDLTRIVRGKLALHIENVDVHLLIQAVAGMYRSDMDAKAIHLTLRLDAAEHFASADPGRLQQVFWNILKNATKFTPQGGGIEVRSTNTPDGRLQLSFTDSGAGMTSQTLARIFTPFEQGSAEIVRRYGGLGLGLTISKAFLEAQNGTIQASSPGPGQGSTFTVRLPAVPASMLEPHAPSASPLNSDGLRRLEILLVEDHEDTSRVLSRLLERLGHRVRVADSVAAAVIAAQQPFDLLLSDIGLPDGTGIDLIQQLRKRFNLTVPAVALTGFGMEEDVAKSREAGFTEHLTKPINFQRLQLMVQKIAETP
jgi:PAS domain S-box-containing protein